MGTWKTQHAIVASNCSARMHKAEGCAARTRKSKCTILPIQTSQVSSPGCAFIAGKPSLRGYLSFSNSPLTWISCYQVWITFCLAIHIPCKDSTKYPAKIGALLCSASFVKISRTTLISVLC